jgi:hypothetical protein
VVNRPFYQPRDTDIIRQELRNLEQFKGVTGIVQPAGVAVFANPYTLKPSNIVLDEDGNAILIDISGIGGVTHEWCALEIRDEISPFDLPIETRQMNDIWAYGKILGEIASKVEDSSFTMTLKIVVDRLTQDVCTRWTLDEAISQLRMCYHID